MKCLLLTCVSALLCASAWASLDQGLVAYYPFNGNASNETGSGWNGTGYGATLTTNRLGDADSAYSFDGINDYINIGNCLGTATTPFTVSLWVKSKEIADTDPYEVFISKKPIGVWDEGQWQLNSNLGSVSFACNDRYGGPVSERNIVVMQGIHDDEWHMLTTVVGAQGSELYIDGALVGTNSSVSIPTQDNAPILIGALPDPSYRRWMTGSMDDVRIYNRALSESEVMQLFNPPVPFAGFYPSTTFVSFSGASGVDHLYFSGSFFLDEASDGIDLAEDEMVIEAGPLSLEIPAGSFQAYLRCYSWNGYMNDAHIRATLIQHRDGCYSFLIRAHGVDLTGWTNPEECKLSIGNDFGETTSWLKGHLPVEFE